MGEALGYEQLASVVSRKFNTGPLPESRRIAANVNGNIENTAFKHGNELALRVWELKVQPAHDTRTGTGNIGLDELAGQLKRRILGCFP